jgi:hypothetical protein
MELQRGIEFIDLSGSRLGPEARLSLSAGVRAAAGDDVGGHRYCASALIPAEPWRSPTGAEFALLLGTHGSASPGAWVSIVTIPREVLGAFDELRSRVLAADSLDHANSMLADPIWKRALDAFVIYAGGFGSQLDASSDRLGIRANAPGLPTVTIDYAASCLIGLHLDSWFNDPLERRHLAPNRVVANLSMEPRYLVYLNLPLRRLGQLVLSGEAEKADCVSHYVARKFMLRNPFYPIVRVRLLPGEAYVAATENMIHDGSTLGMTTWDIHLAILGHFAPSPC